MCMLEVEVGRVGRSVLVGIALIAVWLGAASPAHAGRGDDGRNNLGLRTIKFTVTNQTGARGNLFVYVVGQVPSRNGDWYYLAQRDGDVKVVPKASAPGRSLALNVGKARTVNLRLPQMSALRIYFSIGKALRVASARQGAPPSVPAGWVASDPNYRTLFDWAEFTWNDDGPGSRFDTTIGGNATQVDMFGIAMLISLKGRDDDRRPVTRRAGFSGARTRDNVFADIRRAGAPWSRLVVAPGGGEPLRLIAPYHGIENGVFPRNQLDDYIDRVWAKYRDQPIVGRSENRTYNGRVDAQGDLVFTEVGGDDPPFRFDKPTTRQAYENAMLPVPNPNTRAGDRARAIGALIGGALMRTTLLDTADLNACRVGSFYTDAPVNQYAKVFHRYGLGKKAYSFGFDDTCDQSSFIQVHDPDALTIKLQPL
jgi:hypothetical protein